MDLEIKTAAGNMPVVQPIGQDDTQNENTSQKQTEDGKEEEDNYVPFKEGTEPKTQTEPDDKADDEDVALIRKEAKKVVAPITSTMQGLEAEMQANAFLSRKESEVFLPYSDSIRSVAKDPRTKNLPMDAIVAIALGPKKLMKLGAEMERKAAAAAGQSVTGGTGSARQQQSSNGMKNAWELSDEEFNKTIAGHRL